MISLEQCKRILEADGSKYTDEDVLRIRDFLYKQISIHKMIIDNDNSLSHHSYMASAKIKKNKNA